MMVPDPSIDIDEANMKFLPVPPKAREAQAEASSSAREDDIPYRAASPPLRPSQPSHSHTTLSQTMRSPIGSLPTTYPSSSSPRSNSLSSHNSSPENNLPSSPYAQPPPAYSAAVSQPTVNDPSRDYNTLSSQQLEEGRSPYQSAREPESMGEPRDFSDERTPLFTRAQDRTPKWLCGRNMLLILIALGLVTVSLLASAITNNPVSPVHHNTWVI